MEKAFERANGDIELTRSPIEMRIPAYGVTIAESRHQKGFHMQPTRDDFTKLYYIIDGEGTCYVDGEPAQLSRENLFVIPRDHEHYLEDNPDSPLSLYILLVTGTCLEELKSFREQFEKLDRLAVKHKKPLTAHDYMAYEIPRMLKKILYEQRRKATGYIPSIQASLLNMIVAINRIYEKIPVARQFDGIKPTQTRIQQVADYIASNFYEPISVENMARMACLSVRQFTNQFKAAHGVTFMQFLHYQRVRFAQKLLRDTDQQITSICFESGFNDLAHFYRVFKKITNMSPRKYRLQQGLQKVDRN